MKARIAAVLIVRNEGEHLRACLESVAGWVDEIVVLDSGSSDDTAEIAYDFGVNYRIEPQWHGFGRQRQLAQQQVSAEWCLWLDADERVTPELKEAICAVCDEPMGRTIYTVPRRNWVFGRYLRHGGWYPDRVARLHPTALTRYDDALVHEQLVVGAGMQLKPLRGDLLHFPCRDLASHLQKSARYAVAWADAEASRGKRGSLLRGVGQALGCFLSSYLLRLGFLDGKPGLLIALLSAHATFLKQAELWSRQQPAPEEPS